MKYKRLVAGLLLLAGCQVAQAEQIGSVDTVFKFFGPDHKIVVEAFDDPGCSERNVLYQPGENRRD